MGIFYTLMHTSDGIFETGAYVVPSKSQNPLGQGGPCDVVHIQADPTSEVQ